MIYTVTLNPALDRELRVPALVLDEVLRASATRVDCGGKGFNVSRMLASLGVKSIAMGFAGGHTGEQLRAGLAELAIETAFVEVAGETRTNVSIVNDADGHHLKVNEPGPHISPADQQALRSMLRQRLQPGDWWVLAGSLPPGVPASFYADLIGDIRAGGAFSALDTSGEALRLGCAALPDLVKPNSRELSELSAQPVTDLQDLLRAAQALTGIRYVAVSMGAEGAILCANGRAWQALPPAIEEANPIGAGDSMVAGLVWGLSQGDPLDALAWGVACGAATARQAGTSVGSASDVAQLREQVIIQRL